MEMARMETIERGAPFVQVIQGPSAAQPRRAGDLAGWQRRFTGGSGGWWGRMPSPSAALGFREILLALLMCCEGGDAAAMAPTPMSDAAGELLDQVLNPLLDDFQQSFERGLVLIAHCPDRVLAPPARDALVQRLRQALAELQAARALRAAAPAPMALDMATISPWHSLVLEVWSLSSALRHAGVKTELL